MTPAATLWRSPAHHTEREIDMLGLMVKAVRKHGPPDALYLDNGSTYRGQTLSLACVRMGTALIHAKPYDAPARGKIERFWRTLREGCLDFVGSLGSLHDLNVRLWAFVDQHYHSAPHGGLLGKSPASVYEKTPRLVDAFDEAMLRKALTIHARRRVRRDSTLPMDGTDWENRPALPRRTSRHRLALPHRPERAAVDRARRPRTYPAPGQRQSQRAEASLEIVS
jgi:hypothetical protein